MTLTLNDERNAAKRLEALSWAALEIDKTMTSSSEICHVVVI
jgi:hypothetical protein